MSTSPESATTEAFQTSGAAAIGSLIIIPFNQVQADGAPVMIGKLLSRAANGHLTFQWMWNRRGTMLHPMHLGWTDQRTGVYSWTQPKSSLQHYTPFCNTDDEGIGGTSDAQVMLHGFTLDGTGKLPTAVLRFLSDSDEVPWALTD